jgi:hypothetical protein
MKAKNLYNGLSVVIIAIVITSCGVTTTLESWKAPEFKTGVSKIVVMTMFKKIEYSKPFEQAMCSYFSGKGLKSIGSLEFLNPAIKYPISDIKRKCDSLGVDAILVFDYQSIDKTEQYVPETTTTNTTTAFGGYWGGGYYGGYTDPSYESTSVTSGGYWTTSAVLKLKADLYAHGSKTAIWTGEISVTDPKYVDLSSTAIARRIFSDWKTQNLLKSSGIKK